MENRVESNVAGKGGLVLAVGATGALGAEIVRLACESGRRVRAAVRATTDPAKRQAMDKRVVETVTLDLKDRDSLAAACRGIDAVVSSATAVMSRAPDDTIQSVDELGQLALVEAAENAGVRHFVFVSFLPNGHDYALQRAKRAVEARLQRSKMSFTILQSAAFMEVWLGPALGFDPANGTARVLGDGEQPVSWISAHDVARFAAAALPGGRFAHRTLALGGIEALSPLRVLEIFAELGGPKVAPEHLPRPTLEAMLAHATNPSEESMAASMLVTAEGQVVEPGPALELLPGRLVSVRDHAQRMLKAAGQRGNPC